MCSAHTKATFVYKKRIEFSVVLQNERNQNDNNNNVVQPHTKQQTTWPLYIIYLFNHEGQQYINILSYK